MRKTIAKAVTWRLIGTAEIFAICFWTTGHIATAGHTAGIAAISSIIMYVAHELAWNEVRGGIKLHRLKAVFVQMCDHALTRDAYAFFRALKPAAPNRRNPEATPCPPAIALRSESGSGKPLIS